MRYWKKGKTQDGYGDDGIILKADRDRILSVCKTDEGIKFTEECDGHFTETFSKEDAIKLIDELREWVNAT